MGSPAEAEVGGLPSGPDSGAFWGLVQICPCFLSGTGSGTRKGRPVFDEMAMPIPWPRSQGLGGCLLGQLLVSPLASSVVGEEGCPRSLFWGSSPILGL